VTRRNVDPHNEKIHGANWTEWNLLKDAKPRFPGHLQPNVPAWGYEMDNDPAVMAKKIDAAADNGVDHFIFDWSVPPPPNMPVDQQQSQQ
jgi:hypothetical protein